MRRRWRASAIAGAQNARLAVFMIDPTRADASVFPERDFFRQHSCATAYTEAARLAPTGVNVYDPALYRDAQSNTPRHMRSIGPFEVDQFEYPPPFLLLSRAGAALGLDFFTQRRIWFAVQSLTWLLAVVGLARWIGGRPGAIAGALIPVTMALPPTLLTLQIGNFQITALALCVLAMLAFARARHVPGGIALGLATLSKVFLLSLAAARSPFLPDVYATLASAWLLTLFAAEGGTALRLFGLALMGGACGWLLDAKTLPDPVPIGLLLPTLGIQLTVLALNVWAVARPLQPLAVPALAADATRAETPLQSRLA